MSDEWIKGLDISDELKKSGALTKYKSLEDALRGHVEATSSLSRSLVIPTQEADEERWGEFFKTVVEKVPHGKLAMAPDPDSDEQSEAYYDMMGIPKDGEYNLPEEAGKLPEDMLKIITELGKAAKWSKTQMNQAIEVFHGLQVEGEKVMGEQQTAAENALKSTWGEAYEDRVRATDALIAKYGDEDNPIAATPAVRQVLWAIYKDVAGQGAATILAGEPSGKKSPGELQEELDDLLASKRWREVVKERKGTKQEKEALLLKSVELRRQINAAAH